LSSALVTNPIAPLSKLVWKIEQTLCQMARSGGQENRLNMFGIWMAYAHLFICLCAQGDENAQCSWKSPPCEVCGRCYPHEHVKALYREHNPSDEEGSDFD
jgi:hypothetical protein